MKVLVLGASGGSGHAAMEQLLARGHEVTVFTRKMDANGLARQRLRWVQGDALDARAVERAVSGQDAVVVTLGIRENPLRVRLFGPARTRLDVRSAGTHNVIAAMRKHGVRKLVVQTSYGVGSTRDKLDFVNRLFFSLILKPQIADTELQDAAVATSGLDWVLVQPVHLTDADDDTPAFASTVGETGAMQISRRSVGRFLAEAVGDATFLRQTVSLSGTRAA
jgi:nucleoside-diphosphate-sugar epimerase